MSGLNRWLIACTCGWMRLVPDWALRQDAKRKHLRRISGEHCVVIGDEIGARRAGSWGTGMGQTTRHRWKGRRQSPNGASS
jgi:hypothetical protein